MKYTSSLAFGALSLLITTPALAFTGTFPEDNQDQVIISSPINDDTYAAGGAVFVQENIAGDLYIGGGDVTIEGAVSEDIVAAGGRVEIRGDVGDDIRTGGGEIRISGNVGDDVVAFGGSIRIEGTVEGDVVVAGGEVTINGTVNGALKVSAGRLVLNGTATNGIDFEGEEFLLNGTIIGESTLVYKKITITEGSGIEGDLRYWTKEEDDALAAATTGAVVYDEELKGMHGTQPMGDHTAAAAGIIGGAVVAYLIWSLLSAALPMLILILATHSFFDDAVKRLQKAPWASMLLGFLYFAIMPIAALLFMITVIGIPIGALLVVVYIFSFVFAKVITALVFAKWYMLRNKKKWGKTAFFFLSLGAYLALKLLGFVPVVGWIICMLAVFTAFGAMLHTKHMKLKKIL